MRRMYSESELRNFIRVHGNDVVQSLVGKDISVEGITSKGIANTGGLANIGDVAISGNLTVQGEEKGNITASGLISGGEIVEQMSGYSFSLPASPMLTPAYASACKNGNKLTLVVSGVFNRGESADTFTEVCSFIVPEEIYNKLIPLSGFNSIDNKVIIIYKNNYSTKTLPAVMTKETGNKLRLGAYGPNQIDASTDYAFRYEVTFLLGENLIPEE